MTATNELNRAAEQKKRDAEKRRRDEMALAHDFANDGDCPYCGDLAHLIGKPDATGKILRPCFEWERVSTEEKEPTTEKGGRWDGC